MARLQVKSWLGRKTNKQLNSYQDSFNHQLIPVLNAEAIFNRLQLHSRLHAIKRKVSIDDRRFELMYLNPIKNFCELVQLIPASQAYHHAYPGGLIIHTLAVIEYAIQERQKYTLPLASEPEIIEAQKNLWTYAVFVAALVHDIGKSVTMVNYTHTETAQNYSPIAGSLVDKKVKHYALTFKPTKYYSLHERLGISFLYQLLDTRSLEFLANNLDVFGEVLGYISNDENSWGNIGEIVKVADSLSTAEDLKINPNIKGARKFTGAELENFGERVMRTIRLLINEKSIVINRPGAMMFTADGKYVYAVSKSLTDRVREKMQQLGASDVPHDNTRIFDELQQQGFCESNDRNSAIYKVQINIERKFEQTFTCLKFQINKLFTVNNMPDKISGSIIEITDLNQNHSIAIDDMGLDSHDRKTSIVTEDSKIQDDALTTETDENDSLIAPEIPVAPHTSEMSVIDICNGFFEYITTAIKDKKIIVNKSGSAVHIMNYNDKKVLGIVTPKTFADYAVSADLFNTEADVRTHTETKKAASIIQSAIHKQKLNTPNYNKQIHYASISNSISAKATLSFYLFEVEKLPQKLAELLKDMNISENMRIQK